MMLRCLDEKGGIGVYSGNLIQELLNIDSRNQYVLFYRCSANIGRFARYNNVTERVVWAPNKAWWDQIAIPYACWKEKVDVVFHPKFTVPVLAPCRAAMVVHGADWFIPEHAKFYSPLDVRYIKTMMPLYFRKASAVISVSQITTDNFNRILKLPAEKIQTVYFGPARRFKKVEDRAFLNRIKELYGLPERFILTLSKYRGGERKNIRQIFKAYARYHQKVARPHKLVVGGEACEKYRDEYGIPSNGYGKDIVFTGWIEQEDLPAIYSLAEVFLYPSNVEAFPIPITEAMACGTPIITSNVNGLEEIAGDAAMAVDPDDDGAICEAIHQVLSDEMLRVVLSLKGLERSKRFSWDACAKETLAVLESLAP